MTCVREIIQEHPPRGSYYGYRRILPELEERTGQRANHKRLRRLLSEHELGLSRQASKHSPSPVQEILGDAPGQLNLVADLDPGPLEAFSTDFTEVAYAGGNRKAYLMAVLDLESKYVSGWAVGPSGNRKLAMRCWERVRERMSVLDMPLEEQIVHHDQDSVYTSYRWLEAMLLDDKMRVSYSENGAKGNPWIESLWGRTKVSGRLSDHRGFVPTVPARCFRRAIPVLQPGADLLLDRIHSAPRTSGADSLCLRIKTSNPCCVLTAISRSTGPKIRAHIRVILWTSKGFVE